MWWIDCSSCRPGMAGSIPGPTSLSIETLRWEALLCILLLFCNENNEFDNTEGQMLHSIYHMAFKLFLNHIFGVKTSRFCHLYVTL